MNKRIKELLEEADFCFWGEESWKPEGAIVDWSCDYDKEIQKFAKLLINECINIVGHYTDVDEAISVVKKNFGIE